MTTGLSIATGKEKEKGGPHGGCRWPAEALALGTGPWALLWVVLGCLGSLFAGFLGVPGASEPSFLTSAHLNWEGIQQTGQLRQVPTLP